MNSWIDHQSGAALAKDYPSVKSRNHLSSRCSEDRTQNTIEYAERY